MLLDPKPEPPPRRTKTLVISLAFHFLLVLLLLARPDLLTTTPQRIIRIAGQDYNIDVTELTMAPPPSAASTPAPQSPPMVQPPPPPVPASPQQAAPPPPPPPPPAVIGPDDVLKEGARPDAQARASRGDTSEQARAGGSPEPQPSQPPQQKGDSAPQNSLAQNTNPNALRLPGTFGRTGSAIEESIRRAQTNPTPGGHTGASAGLDQPNFSTEEPTILSDTKGYDFGPYMNQVINRVRTNWFTLMPDIARLGQKGRVVLIFTIMPGGSVTDLRLAAGSGAEPLDRAAMGAITFSNPFQKLPPDYKGDPLRLQFTFLYNMNIR